MRKSNQHYDDIDSLHHMITIFGVMTKEQVMTYLNVTQEKAHQVMTVFRRLNRGYLEENHKCIAKEKMYTNLFSKALEVYLDFYKNGIEDIVKVFNQSITQSKKVLVNADDNETSISLAVIFTLNAIALFIFPPIGEMLGLTQNQFGLWAAIAIHDTSSVVGAASIYGEEALKVATTVKLTRALWIIPLSIVSIFIFLI